MRHTFLIMLMTVLLPSLASAQSARFDPAGCNPRNCAESGWLYDDAGADHTTVWRHGLGTTPRAVSILFSPDPDQRRVMPVFWSWTYQNSGNPVSVEMGRRTVRLHIFSGAPLHGVWRPKTGWESFREGYWKFIVYR